MRRDYPDDPRWPILLAPIAGGDPCGADTRGGAAYSEIKEAQREDDDGDMGVWQHTRKVADWPSVSRLCSNELSRTTKDLQLAAWWLLAEVKLRGFPGLVQGLRLIEEYVERFWEGLYPPIEDGDTSLRTVPLEWIGGRLGPHVRMAPITQTGHSWYRFQESITVPSEEDLEDDRKRRQRDEAVQEGKLTPEEFLEGVRATPASFWEQALSDLQAALETVDRIQAACEPLCPDEPPTFGSLRDAIQEVQHAVRGLPARRTSGGGAALRQQTSRPSSAAADPFAPFDQSAEGEPPTTATSDDPFAAFEGGVSSSLDASEEEDAPRPATRPKRRVAAHSPDDASDDLSAILCAHAAELREADSASPVPYLLLRGLRWGELRGSVPPLHPVLLEAPTLQTRRTLRQLKADGNWSELLEAAEIAAAQPCGRAWLDLHAYTLMACRELGDEFGAIQSAVSAELGRLLSDFPALLESTLDDETPCAGVETKALLPSLLRAGPAHIHIDRPSPLHLPRRPASATALAQTLRRQTHARGRFHYRVRLAQTLAAEQRETAALAILRDLMQEIDDRRLVEWEKPEDLAAPVLLYSELTRRLGEEPGDLTLQLLARLDPLAAAEAG
ncbi:MAG: type VI secretion system protein TssA [Acidobacteria bacterium]|nr:type VI secretion system protein TssA [Acidobacteriota bacterium]